MNRRPKSPPPARPGQKSPERQPPKLDFGDEGLGPFMVEAEAPSKLELNLQQCTTRERPSPERAETASPEVSAILEVSEDHYVPAGVTERARISHRLFTAEMPRARLTSLSEDPRVVSVGMPRSVLPISGKGK